MLENYYDINKKDKFEELFRDLYIGKNPTEERNRFSSLENKLCRDRCRTW